MNANQAAKIHRSVSCLLAHLLGLFLEYLYIVNRAVLEDISLRRLRLCLDNIPQIR
jgi:hypothetical protein